MTAGGSKGRKLLQRCCSEETPSDGLNTYQVVLSLFKCVVGTGSFFLPYGIKQVCSTVTVAQFNKAGLWGGSMGLLVMGGVTIYLNWIIMEAKYKVFGKKPVSYYDLCRYLYGRGFGGLMYFSILLSNVGSCAVYLVTM
jgi:amino acid permease